MLWELGQFELQDQSSAGGWLIRTPRLFEGTKNGTTPQKNRQNSTEACHSKEEHTDGGWKVNAPTPRLGNQALKP